MVQKNLKAKQFIEVCEAKLLIWICYASVTNYTPAVGNARVNARGDELGAGGQIVRKKEDVVKEYYENSKGVADEPAVRQSTSDQTELDDNGKDITDDDWIEDEDGNFVQKDS